MDGIQLDVYLFFRGNCRDAMNFYQQIFGGELYFQTYQEALSGNADPIMKDQIMHASLKGGDIRLMTSDTEKASDKAAKISISLGGSNETKLTNIFEKLSENVEVQYPLKKEFWGDTFGSLTDKFGVDWMVNITAQKS